jgi:hypothetical protein
VLMNQVLIGHLITREWTNPGAGLTWPGFSFYSSYSIVETSWGGRLYLAQECDCNISWLPHRLTLNSSYHSSCMVMVLVNVSGKLTRARTVVKEREGVSRTWWTLTAPQCWLSICFTLNSRDVKSI